MATKKRTTKPKISKAEFERKALEELSTICAGIGLEKREAIFNWVKALIAKMA